MRPLLIPIVLAASLAPLVAWAQPQCQAPPLGHYGAEALCRRLAPMVASRPEQVTVIVSQDRAHKISAHLRWQHQGQSARSPEIEVNTQDRFIDDRAVDRLLRSLLQTSDLP